MAATQDQLDDFHRFATDKLGNGAGDSLEQLLDQWRLLNPTPEEHADNVAAVKAALRDMQNGDRGIPLEEHIRHLREKHRISADE